MARSSKRRRNWCDWVLFLSVAAFLIVACATVPITGRSQLRLISNEQLIAAADQQFYQFMSLVRQKSAVLSPSESAAAAQISEMVNRVSDRIIDAAGLKQRYNWQTVVVKAREANAFVLPNGKIVVFTGIIPIAKTEAGLAAVIGHEVGHVVAQHQAERVSQQLLTQLTIQMADAALAASESKYRPVVAAAMGLGAQFGILLPFSREHESEADHLGLFFMAKAGYDPSEAIGLWERMEAKHGSGPWEFLNTHPSPSTRRAQIRQWLPEAELYYADRTRPLPSDLSEVQNLTAERARQVALAPVASRPSLQPGYWMRFQASNRATPYAVRFDRLESCSAGECVVATSETGATSLYTKDYALVEIRQPDGKWQRFSPPLRLYQWPLRVGASWTGELVVEDSTGRKQQTSIKGEVVAYEPVTTSGGSFMAFKVILSAGGRLFRESWYAPETRSVVRSIQYDARGQAIKTELVDYQKTEGLGEDIKVGEDPSKEAAPGVVSERQELSPSPPTDSELHAKVVGRCTLRAAEAGVKINPYDSLEKWPQLAQDCYKEEMAKMKSQ